MSLDVVDLRHFYAGQLGVVTRRILNRAIADLWPSAAGERVLGVGYPTPYLGLFREDSERCVAFMPAQQGVLKWPTARPTLSVLVEEHDWPAVEGMFERVILIHALEMSHDPAALFREVWRVLAPGGKLLAVVPNRGGLWARFDITPFGHGRPYSRSQIAYLLREASFTPTAWSEALYTPPITKPWLLRYSGAFERAGARLSAPFAGVHLVTATKQVYRAVPQRKERRLLVPQLSPAMNPQAAGASARVAHAANKNAAE
jgi:SAM-dependent methyltransferase